MTAEHGASHGVTTVAPGAVTRVIAWVGLPAVGGVLGWLLSTLAEWAASLPWVPYRGPIELIASLPQPQATLGCVGLGVVVGLVLAVVAEREFVKLALDADTVTVKVGDIRRQVRRGETSAVFLDGTELVILGERTEVLVRVKTGYDRWDLPRIRAAFVAYGWPWSDAGDPHRSKFRRWVEDTPELPPAVNAVLRARAAALERGDHDDAAQLRDELAKLAVVVKDEGKRQFWRRAADPRDPTLDA